MKGLRLLVAGVLWLTVLPGVSQAGIGSELNGLGSFGASLGVMRWWADQDARSYQGHAAQIRPMGKAVFRYRVNDNWLVSLESGFAWNGYGVPEDVTTYVIPSTVGLERRFRDMWGATTSFCVGAGAYVWGRWMGGKTMLDPETSHPLHAVDPGVYVGMAGEFHVSEHVTCTAHLTVHDILPLHRNDFKGVLGGNKIFNELRVGLNYYFSPYQGLIW